jgi:hypothetical protein
MLYIFLGWAPDISPFTDPLAYCTYLCTKKGTNTFYVYITKWRMNLHDIYSNYMIWNTGAKTQKLCFIFFFKSDAIHFVKAIRCKKDLLTYNAPFYLRTESSRREKISDSNQKKIREFKTAKLFPILRCEFTHNTYTFTFAIACKIASFD